MTQAVAVRRDGDTFQARIFWLKAARLLDPNSHVIRVGFESGPKSFDDVWVEHDPAHSPRDQEGHALLREHIQCKWHVTPYSYGYAQLTDPEFINANSRSFLERAKDAQRSFAADGLGVRFKLTTNWRIDRDDPLRQVVNQRSGTLRVNQLFGSAGDRSGIGRIRREWRDHLRIDEKDLRLLARTLAFGEATDSLDDLRDQLDVLFGFVGLRRVPQNESAFFYDDLVYQWMAQGRVEFDRSSLRQRCEQEGLLGGAGASVMVFGLKSFEHPIDRLEDRCAEVLDLVPFFDERYIRSETDWETNLYPVIRTFLLEAAKRQPRLRMVLDAHTSLAFAVGSVLNIKSGRTVELEQRTTGRQIWSADDTEPKSDWATLECCAEGIRDDGAEIAVGIGLTHDVAPAVRAYIQNQVREVGTLLIFKPSTGPGARSVISGRHAFSLAEALVAEIKAWRDFKDVGTVHLFIAGPNAFTFFLGQRQAAIGRVRLYEFDFDGGRGGSYVPSLTLPMPRVPV